MLFCEELWSKLEVGFFHLKGRYVPALAYDQIGGHGFSQMNREEMAKVLERIALLMELKGENPFKVRAYRQGAETVLAMEGDVVELAKQDELKGVKGIGEALRDKLGELARTGQLGFYENLRKEFPDTVFELFDIQGLGPKKIKAMYDALGIDSLEKLKTACQEGKVAALAGFGEKTQSKILDSMAANEKFADRFRLGNVAALVEEILEILKLHPCLLYTSPSPRDH
jgi:DNA polymerase (family 10)